MDDRLHILLGIFTVLISTSLAQSTPTLPIPRGLIPDTPVVVINEFDIDEDSQFIELYDGGLGNTSLKGIAVAFFGAKGKASQDAISLDDSITNKNGYFLLASVGFSGQTDKVIPVNLTTDGLNAIAVYNTSLAPNLTAGQPVTSRGLLDAVVYGSVSDAESNGIVMTLLPGREPLQDMSDDTSLGRCRGWHGLMPQAFVPTGESPNMKNDCELPTIVFNEVNLQNASSLLDWYIELYDGGVGNQSLDGIIMAFYHSELDLSFLAIDLTNKTTNVNGFFVIGVQTNPIYDLVVYSFPLPPQVMLPVPDGIALHLASPKRFKSLTVSLSNYNLIDAVVYKNPKSSDLSVLHTLLPYQHSMNEVTGPNGQDMSISRCACCRRLDSTSFGEGPLTPGAINTDCTLSDRSLSSSEEDYQGLVRISEVKMVDPDKQPDKFGEFIELSVNGFGMVKLDRLVVVLFGSDTRSYRTISLNGKVTNEDGYLLIGNSGQRPTPDIEIEDSEPLISGAGGIALYRGSEIDFPDGSRPWNTQNLLDAVVFGFPGDLSTRLLSLLTPGQALIEVFPNEDDSVPSILRCYSLYATTQLAFHLGRSSPGSMNGCPLPPIVINELNIISTDDNNEFMEISSLGQPFFPLDMLAVILWRNNPDGTSTARGGIGLYGWRTGQTSGWTTDENGLFVIENAQILGTRPTFPVQVSLNSQIADSPGAVSIHVGRPGMFPPGSRVSNEGLVDALVYGVTNGEKVPQDLIDVLLTPSGNPPRTWIQQDDLNDYKGVSINRCEQDNGTVEYILDNLSPNATNFCPRNSNKVLTFNEVHLTAASEVYIELWDMGTGDTELNGLQLVFFQEDGKFQKSYRLLTGRTDSNGYFTIGHRSFSSNFTPDFPLDRAFSLRRGGAAAIYDSGQTFNLGEKPRKDGLMSAVVHVMAPLSDEGRNNFDILTPGSPPFVQTEISVLTSDGIALSRCYNASLQASWEAFIPTNKTYWSLNICPPLPKDVYINEVEVTAPRRFVTSVKDEFIELYDGGRGNTDLKYLTLVLFDGSTPFFGGSSRDVSYFAVDLDGMKTDPNGYFVIGTEDLLDQSLVDLAINTETTPFLQKGIVGVALYHAPVGAFSNGAPATDVSLVDTLIYVTGRQAIDHTLVDTLLPDVIGSGMVVETGDWLSPNSHGSISRCLGYDRLNPQVFILTETVTPKAPNDCGFIQPDFTTTILINEFDLKKENFFIELYDLGAGSTSLDTLTLVLYGTPVIGGDNNIRSIEAVSLHGNRTNGNGYFVIGNSSHDKEVNFYRDAVKGVALYHAKKSQFPQGTSPTTQNLIDVVISNEGDSHPLAGALLPGQIGVYDGDVDGVDRSISRCFTRLPLDMFAFLPTTPTPGKENACFRQKVVFNEININHEDFLGRNTEFIELYDGGVGHIPLTGMILVIYGTDRNNVAIRVLPLNNTHTNSDGYFLISRPNPNFNIPPDFEVLSRGHILPDNAGAIALYHDDQRNYTVGMEPTSLNLVDAIVYGSRSTYPEKLLDILLPGQRQVMEDQEFMEGDESIVRCQCCKPLDSSVYELGDPTPGYDNPCQIPPPPSSFEISINEIGMKTHLFTTEYIELKGPPDFPLDNYFIALYNWNGLVYFTEQLRNKIGPSGFFLIGSPNLSPSPDITFPSRIQNSIDEEGGAVALYYGTAGDFPVETRATDKNLVDAIVYKDDAGDEVTQVEVLTTEPGQLFADLQRDESISRCFWESVRKSNDFTQTDRSPGTDNVCPSKEFKRTIQVRLRDADFDEWSNNAELKDSLRQVIIDGVNMRCECGFNHHYISGEKIMQGSVVYQADFLAFNVNQSALIHESFAGFVSETKTLEIGGQTYKVDDCVEDCVGSNGKRSGESGGSGSGTAVGVTIGMILLVIIIVVVVFILVRKRIICYSKDTRLTGEEVGFSFSPKDGDDAEVEFKSNTYEPSY